METGKRIKELVKNGNIGEEDLCMALNIQPMYLHMMYEGQCIPTFPNLCRIATLYSVPVIFLLAGEDNPQKKEKI